MRNAPNSASTVLWLLLALAIAWPIPCAASSGPSTWRRAYVLDAGLATLRAQPGLHARLLKRLRHGRMIAIVERARLVDGIAWVRVAVTRRTRGWVPVLAIASTGDVEGERRLAGRLETTRGFARLELARLAIDRFPRLRAAARLAFDEEAEDAATLLSRRAISRFADARGVSLETLHTRMLLDPLLDRYVRLGVRFEADPGTLQYRVVSP